MNKVLKHWFAWAGIDITPFKYDNKVPTDKKPMTGKDQKKMNEKKKQNQKPRYFKKNMKASVA